MNVIFCNLCDQINGKCVDKTVSAADLPCTITIANVRKFLHMVFIICDWLWENPPVTHKDDYLEKRN